LEGYVQPLPPLEKVVLKVSDPWAALSLFPNETVNLKFSVSVPEDAKPSTPHWKRTSKQASLYTISDPSRINEPLIPAPLSARLEYRLLGTPLRLKRSVEYLDRDPFKGTRKIPLLVVPPVAMRSPTLPWSRSLRPKHRTRVKLANNTLNPVSGRLSLSPPAAEL
jgi:hypothetical protein